MKTLSFVLLTSLAAIAGPHDAEVAGFRARLDAASAAMAKGDAEGAADESVRAYRAFEDCSFHNALAARDHDLYTKLETDWMDLVKAYERNDASAALSKRSALDADIRNAAALFAAPPSPGAVATNAFVILFREGFEALLILGALAATMRKMQNRRLMRILWGGAVTGVVATFGLYALSLKLLVLSGAGQEVLEGVTMLVAAAVLFWMSYWLISKVDGRKWQHFIQDSVKKAASGGSVVALGSLGFLVVFREGFETVLMLRALQAGGGSWSPVLAGIGVATAALAGVFVAIIVAGVRLPIRAFFSATSALLLALVFKFAGDGVKELQEGGAVARHPASWLPDSAFLGNWLGLHASWEGLVLQAVVLVAIAAGLVWTFRKTSPAATPAARPAPLPQPAEAVR